MPQRSRTLAAAGFTLLPVVLVMSLTASIAFLLNRDNGFNVNLIGAQSDRERARYAAEAGLQAANYKIQNLANPCTGSFPTSGSAVTDGGDFGGATYSAYANSANFSGSTLTLTSTGTYNGASVTLTKLNVYAYQSGIKSWSTPASFVRDTYVEATNATDNYGGDSRLNLDKNQGEEILLRFDLSPVTGGLPAGSKIVPSYDLVLGLQPGATVKLFQPGLTGSDKGFLVKLITQSWVEGTKTGSGTADGATWNRYDGISNWPSPRYDSRTLVSVPDPLLGGVLGGSLSFDVTGAALRWMSVANSNNGIWLDPNGAAKNYRFWSRSDSSNYPRLTASYLLPCGETAP